MSTPDHRLHARGGLRTRSCFNGHDVVPAQLRVVEIGDTSIVVCCPACETEARARILRRIYGSPVAALQQALSDWRGGTGPPGVVLALLDLASEEVAARFGGRDHTTVMHVHLCSSWHRRPSTRLAIDAMRRWRQPWQRGSAD
ncbi:MAG TPA: hypothetical protein VNA86_08980 [bacterium]|nr:hypothetical protein [bacterium]